MGKISDYTRVLASKLADVFVVDQTDNGTTETKSATVEQIGTAIGTLQHFADLDTSNKNLVDAINEVQGQLYLPATASGAIATFTTSLAKPLVDCKIGIVATGGGGTPTTPIPVVGYTGANVTRCGKNLFYYSNATRDIYLDSNGDVQSSTSFGVTEYLPVSSQGIRYRGATDFGNAPCTCYYDKNKTFISSEHHTVGYGNLTIPASAVYFRMSFRLADNTTFMIKVGTTPEDYEAYNGTIIPISWQSEAGTIYGGSLDVTTGVLTKTFEGVDMSTLSWTYNSTDLRWYTSDLALLAVLDYNNPSFIAEQWNTHAWTGRTEGDIVCNSSGQVFCLTSDSVNPPEGLLVYELATPVTITGLTPVEITALVGNNNVFTDTNGNTEVTYLETIKEYIDKAINS